MRKRFFLLCILIFLFLSHTAKASVRITEIMYDLPGADTDREWVEIYNDGTETINLSGWKFNDGSNHNLIEPPQNGGKGNLNLAPSGVAILASNAEIFAGEYTEYTGTLIDTVMNLNNQGDTLKLVDKDGQTVFETTYSNSGAQGDGNALSLDGAQWVSSAPTPGVVNTSASSSTEKNTGASGGVPQKEKPRSMDIEIKTEDTMLFAGLPYEFSGKVFDYYQTEVTGGWFVWSLGDGDKKEFTRPETFSHSYAYPGTYVLTLSYYYSPYYPKPVITKHITLTVVPPEIIVSSVYPDGSIQLQNKSDNDINIGGWSITVKDKTFTLPQYTFLIGGESVTIAAQITGFTPPFTKDIVTLFAPNNTAIIQNNFIPQEAKSTPSTTIVAASSRNIVTPVKTPTSVPPMGEITSKTALSAQANEAMPKEEKITNNWTIFFIALLALIFGGYLFAGNKKSSASEADNFTITEVKED